MQQFLLDNLGRAIDRLIERCALLDKDRTLLAHALARVQQELLRVRASHTDLEQRCRHLEARQEEAALRLEKLLASMPGLESEAAGGAQEESRAMAAAAPAALPADPVPREAPGHVAPPPEHADPAPRETREPLPLARNTVKPFDIGSLTRIARLAADLAESANSADSAQGKSPGKAEEEAPPGAHKTDAALDEAAEFQDRLF